MEFLKKLKNTVIGKALDPGDRYVFQHMSLVAFLAWVGLGADGLSSSCYGPEAAFLALGEHKYLAIVVALLTVVTIFLISRSYAEIIELFPAGGGGYLVASKLLNPYCGMVSGCALIIDYVLTIAISIACGADALFSFLPAELQPYRLYFACFGVLALMVLNMRGVKDSVVPLTPVFVVFLLTHAFAIIYTVIIHAGELPAIASSSVAEVGASYSGIGFWGLLFIVLRAYSLGAGTFTGIEAVSNGLPILKEPRVQTGKKTMMYMALSLSFMVLGLMVVYLLFNVHAQPNKTLNAVFLESMTKAWDAPWGAGFIWVALVSEAMLLFVAAQAGFVDGPRVMANMALDRWMPSRFASLSDRLVAQNGVVLMGLAAFILVVLTHGAVAVLVVLYSINVFITFCLSQAGMVRHWWVARSWERSWKKKIAVNGFGLFLTTGILLSVIIMKFNEGGWVTLIITGFFIVAAILIKRHYQQTISLLERLNSLVVVALADIKTSKDRHIPFDSTGRTAVVLVNGFNGLGLHTLMAIIRNFGKEFRNFVFVQVGVIDSGSFKGIDEIDRLKSSTRQNLELYVSFMKAHGYYAEVKTSMAIDVVDGVDQLSSVIEKEFPGAAFFGGQLVFPHDTFMDRLLHNYTVFAIQRRLYMRGTPFVILPIRVGI